MSNRDTLTVLAEELALTLQPLTTAFTSPEALRDFLEDLGWDFTGVPAALDGLRVPVEQVFNLADSSEEVSAADIGTLLDGIRAVFNAISNLQSASGLTDDFKNEFPRQLVDYLLVEYLLGQQPRWGYLLLALGIIRLEERPAAGARPICAACSPSTTSDRSSRIRWCSSATHISGGSRISLASAWSRASPVC